MVRVKNVLIIFAKNGQSNLVLVLVLVLESNGPYYLFFSKATTGSLLRPTLLQAATYHSSLRELPAPNRFSLILPYLILAGALFEGNPVKVCHNRMSDFKSTERVARVWFEITGTITPDSYGTGSYHQLIVNNTMQNTF